MTELKHEDWHIGTPINSTYGDDEQGRPTVAVIMKITEGPLAGRELKYFNRKWDRESNVHTFRKLRAVGWQGKDPETIPADIAAASKAGIRVRFQSRWVEVGNGFWSADNMRPDGEYVPKVAAPSQTSREMMRQALADAAEDDRRYQEQRAAQRGASASASPGGGSSASPPADKQLQEGDFCPTAGCDATLHHDAEGGLTCGDGHVIVPF